VPMLPDAFSDLEPFAAKWCLATETERYDERLASTMDEMQAFYDAFFGRLDEALTHLDRMDLASIPSSPEDLNLLHLCYSLVQVSFPVEVWRQPRVPDSGAARIDAVLEPPI
jgi:hypothetical protein